ncbi:MAG: tripartite tricarboxylate transporter permease [Bacteroidota bacterium]|nr:tripartite tricarboxylate transporter permease [Bacteroidota bacterium]
MSLLSWEAALALVLGALYGTLFGSIPGLTATLAVALFIPVAFFLDPIIALPAIVAISSVAIYAGDVGAAVARIPGTPASAAYAAELHRVAQARSPMLGLGISALGSSFGGLVGTLVLMAGATALATLAMRFSSFEYFWVAVLGLAAGVFASGSRLLRGLVSLLLGLLLSTVGVDPTLGYVRFHFGFSWLLGGLDYIVAMIGLFGFSEVLSHLWQQRARRVAVPPGAATHPIRQFFAAPLRLILRARGLVARSSFLGVMVGFLPGAGADIGAWIACSLQKLTRRGPPDDERVVLAGASSNNAAVASAWIPALSLGLPGDTVTAMVLAVFMMKGITPGPMLFAQDMTLIWTLYGTFLVANLLLLPACGYLSARMAAQAVRLPLNLLISIIAAACLIGAYAINRNPVDVGVMVGMGAVALMLRRYGFPLAQVVLGMVLGPILEQHFMVSAIKSNWNLLSFFDRPVALVLMALTLMTIIAGVRLTRRRLRRGDQAGTVSPDSAGLSSDTSSPAGGDASAA